VKILHAICGAVSFEDAHVINPSFGGMFVADFIFVNLPLDKNFCFRGLLGLEKA